MGKPAVTRHGRGKCSDRAGRLYKATRHTSSRLMKIKMRKMRASKVQAAPGGDVRPPDVEGLPTESLFIST